MTPINRKPRIWYYRGVWRCNARPWDHIGAGSTASKAYLAWYRELIMRNKAA